MLSSGSGTREGQRVHAPRDKGREVSHLEQVAVVMKHVSKVFFFFACLTGYLQAVGVRLHHASHLHRSQGLQRDMIS